MDILENAYVNACSAAALGDQDAIAFRENVVLIRQGIIDGNIQPLQVSFLGEHESIYETPYWREVYVRSNDQIRNILYPIHHANDLSDPHGMNPFNTPTLDAHAEHAERAEHAEIQNDNTINNNFHNNNQFQLISNTNPIYSTGFTLQEVENLLYD